MENYEKPYFMNPWYKLHAGKRVFNRQLGRREQHAFHVLGLSKIPIFVGSLVGLLAITFVAKLHPSYDFTGLVLFNFVLARFYPNYQIEGIDDIDTEIDVKLLALLLLLITVIWAWGYELVMEATYQGHHTRQVQRGIKLGFALFLLSEAMLFFPFFWAFLHGTLSPSIALGGVWPGPGLEQEVLSPWRLPLVNTTVLLSSGVALVSAHRSILAGYRQMVLNSLCVAILLGILFSWLQFIEYGLTLFTISDGLYGSTFFMLTGLHGFHVIVGTWLLLIAYWRVSQDHFTRTHHVGFETAAWYWHFVDIVWLGVFTCVYF
jgi:cytochrome c oxidase subunit 3